MDIKKIVFIKINITLTLFLMSVILSAQCKFKNTAFKSGETLEYTGFYQLGMIWIKGGSVKLNIADGVYKGKKVYKVFGTGTSAKSFDWIFRLRDTIECYMDKKTLKPYFYSKKEHEKNRHSHHTTEFDYSKKKIYYTKKKVNYIKQDTLDFKGCMTDMVSIAYQSRNIDFESYGQGAKIPINITINGKIYNVYIRYLGHDIIQTRKDQKYECFKIAPNMPGGDMFIGGETMVIWLSKDKNKVPVMIESKVVIGKVKGILKSHENLRSKSNPIFGTE